MICDRGVLSGGSCVICVEADAGWEGRGVAYRPGKHASKSKHTSMAPSRGRDKEERKNDDWSCLNQPSNDARVPLGRKQGKGIRKNTRAYRGPRSPAFHCAAEIVRSPSRTPGPVSDLGDVTWGTVDDSSFRLTKQSRPSDLPTSDPLPPLPPPVFLPSHVG